MLEVNESYPFRWAELPFMLGRAVNILFCFTIVYVGILDSSIYVALIGFISVISTLYYIYKLESLRVDVHLSKQKLLLATKNLAAGNIEDAQLYLDSAVEGIND